MAVTWTAIALAESGGSTTEQSAYNPYGEDSRGLFQINARVAEGTSALATYEVEDQRSIGVTGTALPELDYMLG